MGACEVFVSSAIRRCYAYILVEFKLALNVDQLFNVIMDIVATIASSVLHLVLANTASGGHRVPTVFANMDVNGASAASVVPNHQLVSIYSIDTTVGSAMGVSFAAHLRVLCM